MKARAIRDVMKNTISAVFILMVVCSFPLFSADVSSEMFMTSPFFDVTASGDEAASTATAGSLSTNAIGVVPFLEQLGKGGSAIDRTSFDAEYSQEERVLAAIGNGEYPVTPGDVYTLTYLDGQNPVVRNLQVSGSMIVSIPGLGTVDGFGLTYPQMKAAVEDLVLRYYPYSLPECRLSGTGVFSVVVKGEVSSTQRVPAWGLSRLSSVVDAATSFASTRNVEIVSRDGTSKTYDLYRAMRDGDLSQDPLLSPGDVVVLRKASRIISLIGEVYRPGTYQLLDGQQLSDLLKTYGGGLLTSADSSKIRVERYDDSTGTWNASFVGLSDDAAYELRNLDKVVVERLIPSIQSVSLEGAIAVNRSTTTSTDSVSFLTNMTASKMFYQFYPGETLLDMLRAVSFRFNTTSDLSAMYLVRDGQMIPIDARKILYGDDESGKMRLQGGDRFVVPFNQMYVTVSGAVVSPGTYAYVPDRPVSYYLALAKGISSDASKPYSIKITDAQGKALDTDSIVPPESIINVARNTFSNDIAKTVAIVGLVSSIVAIVANVVGILVDTNAI
ncbi:MAG: SLBB domain-containing protein [Sphaerochaetaceae bacterium]